jgi:hypothetical protein
MNSKVLTGLLLILSLSVMAIHDSMNLALAPSTRECFFEDFSANDQREVEVFVNEGGFLDISLLVYGPLSLEEVREGRFENHIREEKIDARRQAEADSQTLKIIFKPDTEGTYAFCLDNRNAKFITKLVEVSKPLHLLLILLFSLIHVTHE